MTYQLFRHYNSGFKTSILPGLPRGPGRKAKIEVPITATMMPTGLSAVSITRQQINHHKADPIRSETGNSLR
jgi:hypothetical protein